MISNQTQPPSNLLTNQTSPKSSSPNPQPSVPSRFFLSSVGGIGEAPVQPKQPHLSTSHLISTTLNHSRLLNKLPSLQRPTLQNYPETSTPNHSSSNPSSHKYSHTKTYSDSPSSESHHPISSTSRSRTPTLNQLEIPSLIAQSRIRREKHDPSTSRSIVTNLGLAPISSHSSNHPFASHPHHHPSLDTCIDPISLHRPSLLTGTSTNLLRSTSSPSSIPSLLNRSRVKPLVVDQPDVHHQTHPVQPYTHPSPESRQAPQPPLTVDSSHEPHIPNHPFQSFPSFHKRKINPDAYNPQPPPQNSPPCPISIDTTPPTLPPQLNVAEKQPGKPPHPGFSFEPSGKALCKYALPMPRLEATLLPQPSKFNQECLNKRKDGENRKKLPIDGRSKISFPPKTPEISSDTSMEILKERYWSARNDYLDAQQIWAEIYISKLERKLWKSQAETDVSADCLTFCMPLGSRLSPHKPQYSRRRAASASDAEQARPRATSSHLKDHSQSKTTRRGRFDFTGFYKAFPHDKTHLKLLTCQRSSPLEISDGPLRRLPCISSSNSQSSGIITPYRSDLFSPPRRKSVSTHRPAEDSTVLRPGEMTNAIPNSGPDRGYRIVWPTANNQQHKSSRRRSRSVPDFRPVHLHSSASLESRNDTIGFPSWAPDEPTSPIITSIPQGLIDAIFPPASESPANTPRYLPDNLLSIDSSSQPVRRVSSTTDLHQSICATIEVSDNADRCSLSDPSTALSVSSEPTPKGPLYSLPRLVEPRTAAVVPLPPPPRKRNVTPSTSAHSSSQNSLVGAKRTTSETNRSTVETKWSINDSMIANLSFATPSDTSGLSRPLTSSLKFTRTSSPPIPPKPLPDPRADVILPKFIQPAALIFETPQKVQRRSSSYVYATSPTCESPVDSLHTFSGVFSQVSSQRCSLGLADSFIEREDSPSPFITSSPPLSALYLDPATQYPPGYVAGDQTNTFVTAIHVTRKSSNSSPSESSNSVIDPDKPINQADLFYQVPASPRRSLIQDYDDRTIKSRHTSNDRAGEGTLTPIVKQSGLIDDILAGYAVSRRAKIMGLDLPRLETEQLATAPMVDLPENQDGLRSTESGSFASLSDRPTPWVPIRHHPESNIVDAFEARRPSHSPNGSRRQNN